VQGVSTKQLLDSDPVDSEQLATGDSECVEIAVDTLACCRLTNDNKTELCTQGTKQNSDLDACWALIPRCAHDVTKDRPGYELA
jgi:hypothetical protein